MGQLIASSPLGVMGSSFNSGDIEEGTTFVFCAWTFVSLGNGSFARFLADRPSPYLKTATPPEPLRDLVKNQLSTTTSASTSTSTYTSTSTPSPTPIGTHQVEFVYNSLPNMEGAGDSEPATPSDNHPSQFPFGLSNSTSVYHQMYTTEINRTTSQDLSLFVDHCKDFEPPYKPSEDDNEDSFTILLDDNQNNATYQHYYAQFNTKFKLEEPLVRLSSGLVITRTTRGLIVHWPGSIPPDSLLAVVTDRFPTSNRV